MRLNVYKRAGGWYWTLYARNGRAMARSGHSFRYAQTCYNTARTLFPWFTDTKA